MKKIIVLIGLILAIFTAQAQFPKPTPNDSIKTVHSPSFQYDLRDSTVIMGKGPYLYNKFFNTKTVQHKIDSVANLYRIPEAPYDHKTYGRKDSTWVEITSSSTFNQTEIFNEIPYGLINGINLKFVIDTIPITNSERLFLNGVRQLKSYDYSIVDDTITFSTAPQTGDLVTVDYLKIPPLIGTNYYYITPTGTIDGVNQNFTVTNNIYDNSAMIYLNGVRQYYTIDFTTSGNTITFVNPPELNDIIIIDYKNIAP